MGCIDDLRIDFTHTPWALFATRRRDRNTVQPIRWYWRICFPRLLSGFFPASGSKCRHQRGNPVRQQLPHPRRPERIFNPCSSSTHPFASLVCALAASYPILLNRRLTRSGSSARAIWWLIIRQLQLSLSLLACRSRGARGGDAATLRSLTLVDERPTWAFRNAVRR